MKLRPVLVSIALVFCSGQSFAADGYPPYITAKKLYADVDLRGKEAPALTVKKWLSGSPPKTDGKVVLIDFWATWCPPCRELVPELNEYKKKFGDDLVVIGVTDESEDTIKQFMKNTPIDYNIGLDPDKQMFSKIGIKGIPHVLVISADHIVRWQGFPPLGEDPLTEGKIAQIIAAGKAH